MALTKWRRFDLDWPERWHTLFDLDTRDQWLRVEEVHENGDLVVRAELPGVDPEKDVEVSVSDGVLHISAKRQERSEEKDKDTYRSEFRYGEFTRDLVLPRGVDKGTVKADYKDGILEVRIPWPVEPEPTTKVPIGRS